MRAVSLRTLATVIFPAGELVGPAGRTWITVVPARCHRGPGAHDQAKQLMAELRELIHGIQPQILTDLGLPAALGELADQSPIPVTVDSRLDGRLPGYIENIAYFAAAEALTNVAKHSGATAATVSARLHGGLLTIEISDSGRGGADPGRGTGLTGLADRVAVADGRMLLSSPAGGPTVLRVEVPCPQSTPSSG